MKRNIGTTDRIIRVIGGLAILAAGLLFGSWWGLIGLLPLGTAAAGYCPVYALLKINTCGKDGCQGAARQHGGSIAT